MELGPTSRTRPYNGSLLRFINDCQRYTSDLPLFKKYVLWRYTIGSASINKRLIFQSGTPNDPYWVYLFFLYFRNTVRDQYDTEVKPSMLPPDFRKLVELFVHPEKYANMHIDQKVEIANVVIPLYIRELQDILKGSPMVTGTGFVVYKVSGNYPGLPDPTHFEPTLVPQIPFNSCTISSDFNFSPFIAPTGTSYLYQIFIPGGTKGPLFIDSDLHAYSSFEHEILLPAGCVFDIQSVVNVTLDYIDPQTVSIKNIQDKSNISMGNVFDLSEYTTKPYLIQKKPFIMFNVLLR